MNLLYGQIIDVFPENGFCMGRVRIAGAHQKVPLDLVTDPQRGDTVLLCDGIAISKVEEMTQSE